MMYAKFGWVCGLLLLTGCASNGNDQLKNVAVNLQTSPMLQWKNQQFSLVDVPQVKDIFDLSPEQQQAFLGYYQAAENVEVEGHKRLANYLEEFLVGFSYRGNTYPAHLAAIKHSGNCLSLAILTKAYANLVGLKIEYRRVNSEPIYQQQNGLLKISSHVQTYVYSPVIPEKKQNELIFRGRVVIDYFPTFGNVVGDMINDADFFSMYYQNLAAEALVETKFDLAYSLLSVAMELSPSNPATLNTLAVLYKKNGHVEQAESIYKYVLEHTNGSVNTLSNYVVLLEQQGRSDEVIGYEEKYLDIEDDNPYRWYDLANDALANEHYSRALYLFQKSSRMAPYLHENYFGQAQTYYQLGKTQKAKLAMEKAAELAYTPSDEKLYMAKLRAFGSDH